MPTTQYKITNKATGETKVINWQGDSPPTNDDIKAYFAHANDADTNNEVKQPANGNNQSKSLYDTVKEYASRGYDALTKPLAPDITLPYTMKAGDITDKNDPGFATRAMSEIAQRGYDKIIRPALSPIGGLLSLAGGGEALGVPGAKAATNGVLGGLAAKGAYDAVGPVKTAINNPNAENVSDAALATITPALMGYGAVSNLRGGAVKPTENIPVKDAEIVDEGNTSSAEPPLHPDAEFAPVGSEGQYNQNAMLGLGKPLDIDQATYDKLLPKMEGTKEEGLAPIPPKGKYINPDETSSEPQKAIEGDVEKNYGPFDDEWAKYVNGRSAAKLEGNYVAKRFSYLDQDVPDNANVPATYEQLSLDTPIVHLQNAMKDGFFPEVRQHFDDIHQALNDAGVDTAYKEDYLPQMWDNSPEEISNALGKRLTAKPSFTYESFFKDYQEGIEAGLTPKFTKPSDLISYYTNYAKKAIADKQFLDYLKDTGQLRTDKPSSDWRTINPDFFPKAYQGKNYTAPKPIVDTLENYFTNPENGNFGERTLDTIADLTGKTTRTVLGFHIPGTAWSMHGINTSIANALYGEDLNPLKAVGRLGESAYYLTRPNQAENFLSENPASAIRAVKDGGLAITGMSSDVGSPLITGDNLAAKGLNILTSPKPLFQQFIPSMMLKAYERQVKYLTDKGVDYPTAAKQAGNDVNNTFGVLNREQSTSGFVADKNLNNVKRIILLAPNWLESRGRISVETAKAMLDPNNPIGRKYLSGVTNFLASYAGLQGLNYLSSGHSTLENGAGKELSLSLGKDSKGKDTYLNPYAGAIDFIKVPLDIAHSALEGNLAEGSKDIRSRASEPAQFAIDLLSNTDWKGSPILGDKDSHGKSQSVYTQVGNLGVDATSHFAPIGLEGAIDYSRDKISPEEAASRVLQLPLSYRSEPKVRRHSPYAPVPSGPRMP